MWAKPAFPFPRFVINVQYLNRYRLWSARDSLQLLQIVLWIFSCISLVESSTERTIPFLTGLIHFSMTNLYHHLLFFVFLLRKTRLFLLFGDVVLHNFLITKKRLYWKYFKVFCLNFCRFDVLHALNVLTTNCLITLLRFVNSQLRWWLLCFRGTYFGQ